VGAIEIPKLSPPLVVERNQPALVRTQQAALDTFAFQNLAGPALSGTRPLAQVHETPDSVLLAQVQPPTVGAESSLDDIVTFGLDRGRGAIPKVPKQGLRLAAGRQPAVIGTELGHAVHDEIRPFKHPDRSGRVRRRKVPNACLVVLPAREQP